MASQAQAPWGNGRVIIPFTVDQFYSVLRLNAADMLLRLFKPGSLKVRMDDQVTVGQPEEAVGNSGNISEPHLHTNAQRRGTATEPFSGCLGLTGLTLRANIHNKDTFAINAFV